MYALLETHCRNMTELSLKVDELSGDYAHHFLYGIPHLALSLVNLKKLELCSVFEDQIQQILCIESLRELCLGYFHEHSLHSEDEIIASEMLFEQMLKDVGTMSNLEILSVGYLKPLRKFHLVYLLTVCNKIRDLDVNIDFDFRDDNRQFVC
jgi:hypothetical protein